MASSIGSDALRERESERKRDRERNKVKRKRIEKIYSLLKSIFLKTYVLVYIICSDKLNQLICDFDFRYLFFCLLSFVYSCGHLSLSDKNKFCFLREILGSHLVDENTDRHAGKTKTLM